MIDLEEYEIFTSNISTLRQTSKDNHEGKNIYMTNSKLKVINFDGVKKKYVKPIRLVEMPKSNDALYIGTSDDITFIEFKNGYIDKKKRFDICIKIFDSLLIFMDIVKKTADYTRGHLDYILVYNETRNPMERNDKSDVQFSESRTVIAKTLIEKKARKKFIRFGLERFEKLYFRAVYTYTEREFEDNFIAKYSTSSINA